MVLNGQVTGKIKQVCVSSQLCHYHYGGHLNGEINIQEVFIECLVCDQPIPG